MARKLRVGAVGIGNIFREIHAEAWRSHTETQLVAVCDVVPGRAQAFAQDKGVPFHCTDYRDLVTRSDVDIVDICTPNLLHSQIAVAALNAGKHVFCEKPDAVNPAEVLRMAAAAKRNRRLLMVMRNNRFRPESQFIKRYISAGQMGDIYTGRCGWIRRRGIPGKGGWFTTKRLSGGGPLIDLGVHMIDLAVWLMGNPRPVAVAGATYRKFAESGGASDSVHSAYGEAKAGGVFDVEDLASGYIRFDNGATLQIEFSWASNVEQEDAFVQLRGTHGGCDLSNVRPLKLFTEFEGTLCDVVPRLERARVGQHAANLFHFVDCLRHRDKPCFTPDQGVNMIRVLSAIYRSAHTGREVRL